MTTLGPGDVVECIRKDRCTCGYAGVTPPNVYRIAALAPPPEPWEGWWCLLCSTMSKTAIVVEGQEDHAYCPCCFKPGGYRTDAGVRQALQNKERERA